ncbi:uncharacterized protein LOC135703400 [Ochlerotatus camptorhynchus]|uniref:uncharacterized protein LOC135703400 n=1 Tax=Ochlerotatus camptorhynchus TaxID=644619 RepID=UPI0031D78DF8
MSFAIVQTLSAGGRKELSAVPEKWLDKSIQGDILLWPNVKSSTEQATLLRDENSTPGKSWLKFKCRIKRKNMPSYAQAALVIDEMSGCSSSDVSMVPRKRKKNNKTAPANFQSMLNLPSVEPSPQITITPFHDVPPNSTNAPLSNNQNAPIMKTAGSPPRTPLQPILVPVTPNFNQPYFEFDQNNRDFPEPGNPQSASENSIEQCVDYLKQLIDMQRKSDAIIDVRISSLEKRLAHQSTQMEFIMDAIRCRNGQDGSAEAGLSFNLEPINDYRKFEDFEKSLENESYRSNLMKWLRVNVSGDCADDRMICLLDLIMTKEFQVQCTWTGSSRKGPKIAVMIHRRFLKVFVDIGTDETEIVTQHKLANFFKKKLKNATKRLQSAGIRRSSRHVVKKRNTKRGKADYRSDEQTVDNMKGQAANQNSDDTLQANCIQDTNEIQVHQHMTTENSEPHEPSTFIDEAPSTEKDMDSVSSSDMSSTKDVSSYESIVLEEYDLSDDNISDVSD